MLGIFLIYFIGKRFYDLAVIFDKNKWAFAVAGIATYYVGAFMGGFIIALIYELWGTASFDDANEFVLNLIAFPFGIIACVGLYKLLEKNWKRKPAIISPNILDDDLVE
jgi:hypothetical protein